MCRKIVAIYKRTRITFFLKCHEWFLFGREQAWENWSNLRKIGVSWDVMGGLGSRCIFMTAMTVGNPPRTSHVIHCTLWSRLSIYISCNSLYAANVSVIYIPWNTRYSVFTSHYLALYAHLHPITPWQAFRQALYPPVTSHYNCIHAVMKLRNRRQSISPRMDKHPRALQRISFNFFPFIIIMLQ